MTDEEFPHDETEGSWTPLLILSIVVFICWIAFGSGSTPRRLRRWYNLNRVQMKKRLGLRDESIYNDGAAGDGANQRHKRQG